MSWHDTLGAAAKAFLSTVGVLVAFAAACWGLFGLLVWVFVGPGPNEAWGHLFMMGAFAVILGAIIMTPVLLILFYRRFKR